MSSVKSFDQFDSLDLLDFAKALTAHSIAEYPFVEGSLVLSLNGGIWRR
jgi:hypothetical protein